MYNQTGHQMKDTNEPGQDICRSLLCSYLYYFSEDHNALKETDRIFVHTTEAMYSLTYFLPPWASRFTSIVSSFAKDSNQGSATYFKNSLILRHRLHWPYVVSIPSAAGLHSTFTVFAPRLSHSHLPN